MRAKRTQGYAFDKYAEEKEKKKIIYGFRILKILDWKTLLSVSEDEYLLQ